MKVDIKFIAKKAGVSPATVSRVLNGSKPVSPQLQEKVMQEIQKYQYRPNSMARGLILKKSNMLAVITPNVSHLFHAKLISAIEAEAEQHGYNVLISNIQEDFKKQKQNFITLCERQVDGILLLHEHTTEEARSLLALTDIPVVLASIHIPYVDAPSVSINDRQASYEAVEYLIKLGHRRIGALLNPCHSLGVLRREGYEKAMNLAGLPILPGYTAYCRCAMEDGASAAEKMFCLEPPPTALFCVSDEIAIGAMDYLLSHGCRVPEDVSVIGFDDIGLAQMIRPRLTSVHQPIELTGQLAARKLIHMIEGRPEEESCTLLPYRLMLRDSCASPSSAL